MAKAERIVGDMLKKLTQQKIKKVLGKPWRPSHCTKFLL